MSDAWRILRLRSFWVTTRRRGETALPTHPCTCQCAVWRQAPETETGNGRHHGSCLSCAMARPSGYATNLASHSPTHSLTHPLTSLALKSALAGGGVLLRRFPLSAAHLGQMYAISRRPRSACHTRAYRGPRENLSGKMMTLKTHTMCMDPLFAPTGRPVDQDRCKQALRGSSTTGRWGIACEVATRTQ